MVRTLQLGGIAILLIVLAASVQGAWQAYRFRTGPSGWFEVQENLRRGSQEFLDRSVVIGGPFSTETACEKDLGELKLDPFNTALSCQRMLISDAAKFHGGMAR